MSIEGDTVVVLAPVCEPFMLRPCSAGPHQPANYPAKQRISNLFLPKFWTILTDETLHLSQISNKLKITNPVSERLMNLSVLNRVDLHIISLHFSSCKSTLSQSISHEELQLGDLEIWLCCLLVILKNLPRNKYWISNQKRIVVPLYLSRAIPGS